MSPENRGVQVYWRTQLERYRLEGERCTNCGEVMFPKHDVCSGCGAGGAGWKSEPEKESSEEVIVFDSSDE